MTEQKFSLFNKIDFFFSITNRNKMTVHFPCPIFRLLIEKKLGNGERYLDI